MQRELEQAKQELTLLGSAASRLLQKKVSRLQRKANRALQKANDALLKANVLAKQAAVLRQRAVKGIDKNIIEGAYQYALDSASDLSDIGSFGFELLRNPEMLVDLLDAIEETRTALQDPVRRAEVAKLIGEALGEGVVDAIENFSNDKDYYTGYIAASIFDPIGKIGKLGKLSDVARGIKRIGSTKNILTPAQASRVNTINNIIRHNAKPDDFKGVSVELKGIKTGFDHITEMKQSVLGLSKAINALESSLKNPNLSDGARKEIEFAIRRGQAVLDKMNNTLKGK